MACESLNTAILHRHSNEKEIRENLEISEIGKKKGMDLFTSSRNLQEKTLLLLINFLKLFRENLKRSQNCARIFFHSTAPEYLSENFSPPHFLFFFWKFWGLLTLPAGNFQCSSQTATPLIFDILKILVTLCWPKRL